MMLRVSSRYCRHTGKGLPLNVQYTAERFAFSLLIPYKTIGCISFLGLAQALLFSLQ
jgi:hypothetical protein